MPSSFKSSWKERAEICTETANCNYDRTEIIITAASHTYRQTMKMGDRGVAGEEEWLDDNGLENNK